MAYRVNVKLIFYKMFGITNFSIYTTILKDQEADESRIKSENTFSIFSSRKTRWLAFLYKKHQESVYAALLVWNVIPLFLFLFLILFSYSKKWFQLVFLRKTFLTTPSSTGLILYTISFIISDPKIHLAFKGLLMISGVLIWPL